QNAVTAADLEKELDPLQSQRFCALLDVNFKGFDAGKEKVNEPNLVSLFRTFLGRDDRDDQHPPLGRVVCLASSGRRPSLDLEKQGVFAQALREGLASAADTDGYEPDGVVSMEELLQYLLKRIPELARTHGTTKEDKVQTPLVFGSRTNRFPLARNPAVAGK